MISSDKKVVQALVDACLRNGMKTVVCSPGSRNAPLVIAMDEHPDMECFMIHDERSAAFIAMGIAQERKYPVGVVCTSGSALLNYYPAVAEAYYQRIPLVVISADRPEKWINQGDGQTIVQQGVYTNHIEGEVQLNEGLSQEEAARIVNDLFAQNATGSEGPLHINVALEEPLYRTEEIPDTHPEPIVAQRSGGLLSEGAINRLKEGVNMPRKLVLVGQMPKNEYFARKLMELADDPSYAILVENTSNLVSQKWIHCIDRTLERTQGAEETFAPDVLITFGGAIVSKRIKAFLRKYKPKMHWKVGYDFPEMDTYEALTDVFRIGEGQFVQHLIDARPDTPLSTFGAMWKQQDFLAQEQAANFLQTAPYCDLKVFELLLDYIPDDSHFHMANSSVVRYCQLFDPVASIHYFSNRGTSGIDGSVSTAVGAALGNKDHLHVLITGDVSFFYDSNALWNNYKIPNLRIFLINNGGGGIFNIIPGPRSSKQNKDYFEAQHQHSAEHLCKAFNVEYFHATDLSGIETQLENFYSYDPDGGIRLMEIHTTGIENHLILDDYFSKL